LNARNPSKTDETLVAQARRGDTVAFDDLVIRYQDRVFNMSYRMLGNREDAMDVSQEVFVTVFRSIGRFQERARFGTWLYRIIVNRCRDELRRRVSVKHTRPASLSAGDVEPAARVGAGPVEQASARELQVLLERAIAELPEDVREVMVLRDTEDLAYEEIAAIVDVPVGTVRSRLNRARTLLKERLAPLLEAES